MIGYFYNLLSVLTYNRSTHEELVLWLPGLLGYCLFFALLIGFLVRVLGFVVQGVRFAQKPLFTCHLDLGVLLDFILVDSVLGIKFFLPGKEVFDCHWSKSSKFGSFEHFHLFGGEALLNFQRSALDEVLMDPVSGLLNNIEHDRLLLAATDDFLYFFDDIVDVVPGDACDRLDLVLERCEGVLLGVLEHEVDLVLH